MRDEFDEETKDTLAHRVGLRCSNLKCRQPTSGPQTNPTKVINIGVAAHIAAASPGGKRFDPKQSSEQRKSSDNGIWLCQSCAKLVDSDEKRYTVERLKEWKAQAEALALREIEEGIQQLRGNETDPLDILLKLLDEPDNWIKVQGDQYIRHRYNSQFVIKAGETINDDYREPWTQKFPDNHASSLYVEYWQGSTLLKTSCFVVTDGGRYCIPLPKIRVQDPEKDEWENIEFSIDMNGLEWKTAMLFDQYDSLRSVLPRVGVNLTS